MISFCIVEQPTCEALEVWSNNKKERGRVVFACIFMKFSLEPFRMKSVVFGKHLENISEGQPSVFVLEQIRAINQSIIYNYKTLETTQKSNKQEIDYLWYTNLTLYSIKNNDAANITTLRKVYVIQQNDARFCYVISKWACKHLRKGKRIMSNESYFLCYSCYISSFINNRKCNQNLHIREALIT